jgi:hypothetical protein
MWEAREPKKRKQDVIIAKNDDDYLTRIPKEAISEEMGEVALIDLHNLPVIAKVSAHSFVCATFIKSLRENPFYRALPEKDYFASANAIVNSYIETNEVKLIVDPNYPEYFYGYIIMDRDLEEKKVEVIYIYIKYLYRKRGLMRMLLETYLRRKYKVSYRYSSKTLQKILSFSHKGFKTLQDKIKYSGF